MNNKYSHFRPSSPIYITGMAGISPQQTFNAKEFPACIQPAVNNTFRCIDPNYKDYIPAEIIRRMSRVIRMGVAAGKSCLQDGNCEIPDAIVTGTGLGCVEDTEKFLSTMINNKEEFLTPTSFIQSTHNTISAQLALLLKCHSYNFTYVHRGFSFESAFLDGLMQLGKPEIQNVLLAGIDELTPNVAAILKRLGHLKKNETSSRGTIAGEGAAFFLLGKDAGARHYARIEALSTLYKPSGQVQIEDWIRSFITSNGLSSSDIDIALFGLNGDKDQDAIYHTLSDGMLKQSTHVAFKHWCGEYFTASSFALWMASMMLFRQEVPEMAFVGKIRQKETRNVLVYNHYRNINHSLFLLSR